MFDFIEGSPEKLTPNHAVINVGGVGFGVSISTSSYEALKLEPGKIKLFTYLHVRENVLELYGFVRIEDKEIFLMLMEVNGIGAKSAMNILNKITAAQLQRAIASEDSKTLYFPTARRDSRSDRHFEIRSKSTVTCNAI